MAGYQWSTASRSACPTTWFLYIHCHFHSFPPLFLDIVKTGYDMLLLVLLLSLLLPLILFSKNHNDIDTIHKADPITVRLCLPNERRTIGLLPATATSSQCYAFTKTTKFFNTVYLVEYKNPVAAAMRRREKHLKSKRVSNLKPM